MKALNVPVQVRHYDEHSLGSGADAKAVAFVEVAETGQAGDVYGVGIDPNIITASFKAVISAANRAARRHTADEQKALYKGA
jgi:2-isopropylmalate synthase